jgi:4-methylaminobutanoate oxidase (formaldehyde-forming)
MTYVPCEGQTAAEVLASSYEVDVMGTKVKAEVSLKPMYDASGVRTKG